MPESAPSSIQFYPLGDAALVVQFGNSISPGILARLHSLSSYLKAHPPEGVIEWVPGYTTLTIYYNLWQVSEGGERDAYQHLLNQLQQILEQLPEQPASPARLVEIPVCYGGAWGPDMEEVARHTGLSAEEIIALHTKGKYLVYMIGFAPGFAYLGGMDERLATPRKESPRTAIPQGSVGIAGQQTGVYPLETPGGWQLIGRTPLLLFDAKRTQPSLLQMGDKVRFVSIGEEEFKVLERRQYVA